MWVCWKNLLVCYIDYENEKEKKRKLYCKLFNEL